MYMHGPKMAAIRNITAPELDQFVVTDVELTDVQLGVGGYGCVLEVEIPGAKVAAKKLHPQMVKLGSPQQVKKWISDFVDECKLMSKLRHPNIVQFLGICYLPGSHLPVLLMEKLQTNLDSLLESNPNIPIDVKTQLQTGIIRGVVYLHSQKPPIIHRDLTARNVLIDSGMTAKVADLGVARIINVKPGQIAATMSRLPGNGLYMPPETAGEEGATRYNASIDIFSFGVIALFVLTQTFPKDLKPATYHDPITGAIKGRSEIERREEYVTPMKSELGENHPLVQLTLECLEYIPSKRPPATKVLKILMEFGVTLPQTCTATKLDLICQREEERNERDVEKTALIDQFVMEIHHVRAEYEATISELKAHISTLQETVFVDYHEKKLDDDLQNIAPKIDGPKHKTEMQPKVPSSIAFDWKRCEDIPKGIHVYGKPVALNGKLYARGKRSFASGVVLEYNPDHDQWKELPPLPVYDFTVATHNDQLLVVGGIRSTTGKTSNIILKFDENTKKWVNLAEMPVPLSDPIAIEDNHSLVILCGYNEHGDRTSQVILLGTKLYTTKPLPLAGVSRSHVVIDNHMYLIAARTITQSVVRAHIPSLTSETSSSMNLWENLPDTSLQETCSVAIDNNLLAVGGKRSREIQLYNPSRREWTKIGELPEPMYSCNCVVISGRLYVLGSAGNSHTYVSTFKLTY